MPESEVWMDVVGYEGYYKVSNKGNVRSVERTDALGRKQGGLTLRLAPHTGGYLCITLNKNGKKKTKLVHRLVAETFLPNPNNYPEVNHLDEDKTNNELSNLEWCEPSYNINYGPRNKKDAQTKSKKVRAINIESGEVATFSSTKDAMRKGYSSGNVSAACRGIYYGGNLYRGYEWSYE